MTVVSVRCGDVQALQKRLISRTEEVVEVERILQEKDRLYLELRVVLERQPGPEVAQQISSYQRVGTHLPQVCVCGGTPLPRGVGGDTHLPQGGTHLLEWCHCGGVLWCHCGVLCHCSGVLWCHWWCMLVSLWWCTVVYCGVTGGVVRCIVVVYCGGVLCAVPCRC